ncbi:hypothetical protein F4782DRAFT_26402 [Xylaria castorea]|nr:hypothetical protein F4782DRAFT_26402 [Xylaria castorea]
MDPDTSDFESSGSDSDSTSSGSDWPSGNVYLTPNFLKTLQGRLVTLKAKFRTFLEEQDPEVGFNLEWMLVHVCEKSFVTIRFIAMHVPPKPPMDPYLAAVTNDLVSELQAVIGDSKPPDFVSQIDALPNPDWDAVFQGYCRVLEASIEAYLIGDSPVYQVKLADAAAPDQIYRVLRRMVMALERYPFLWTYQKRLMRKLEGSRSGSVWTKWWMKEAQINPPPKRKLDALGLDDGAKKRIEKEMSKCRKLDRLLSCPPGL